MTKLSHSSLPEAKLLHGLEIRYALADEQLSALYQMGLQDKLLKLQDIGKASLAKLSARFDTVAGSKVGWLYELVLQVLLKDTSIGSLMHCYCNSKNRVIDMIQTPIDYQADYEMLLAILQDFTEMSQQVILRHHRDGVSLRTIAKEQNRSNYQVGQSYHTTIRHLEQPRYRVRLEQILFGNTVELQ